MWIVFSLLAAFSMAIVITLSKAGIKNIEPSVAFAIQAVMIIILSWSVVAFQGNLGTIAKIEKRTWIYLIVAGLVTCLSSLFSFHALKIGDASRTGSLDKVSLVFSILFAVLFLKEKINWQIVVGALLMVGGAVLIAVARKSS